MATCFRKNHISMHTLLKHEEKKITTFKSTLLSIIIQTSAYLKQDIYILVPQGDINIQSRLILLHLKKF